MPDDPWAHRIRIEGRVLQEDGEPVHGLTVEPFDEKQRFGDQLGRTLTTAAGQFSLLYTREGSPELFESSPDIGLRVLDRWGELIHTGKERIPWAPGRRTIELRLRNEAVAQHLSAPTSWERIEGPLVPEERMAEIDAAIDLVADRGTARHDQLTSTANVLRPGLLRFGGLLGDAFDVLSGDPEALRRFVGAMTVLAREGPSGEVSDGEGPEEGPDLGVLDRWHAAVREALAGMAGDGLDGLIPHDRFAPLSLAAAYAGVVKGKPDLYLGILNDQLCGMRTLESVALAARGALGGDPRDLEYFGSVLDGVAFGAGPAGGRPGEGVVEGIEGFGGSRPEPGPGPFPDGCPIPWPPTGGIEELLQVDPWELERFACMLEAQKEIIPKLSLQASYSITGIAPTTACAGQQIVITGSGFGATAEQVSFPGRTGGRVTASVPQANWADTQITVTVPAGATCGPLALVKAAATVEACGRYADAAWQGTSTAPFGGSEAHIKSFTANGKIDRLRVDPGDKVTFAWSVCPASNAVVTLRVYESPAFSITVTPSPGVNTLVFPTSAYATTTRLECTLSAANQCSPARDTATIAVTVAKLPDLTIQGIEVTQAIQHYRAAQHLTDANDRGNDNSLGLVADKETWVRVYVRSGQDPLFDLGLVPRVRATLDVSSLSGASPRFLQTVFPDNFQITAQANPAYAAERGTPARTINFRVPGNLCKGQVRFDVTLRTDYIESGVGPTKIEERDYTNNTRSETLDFSQRRVLRLRGVYVAYDFTDGAGNRTQLAAPTRSDLTTTADWLERAFPVSEVTYADAGTQTLTVPLNDAASCAGCCSPNWGTLLSLVAQSATADCNRPDSVYYGLFPTAVPRGPVIGCAGSVAAGAVGDGQTMAHEVGHACGLMHAPCGGVGTADPGYPAYEPYDAGGVANASIGEFGLDIDDGSVRNPQNAKDFMSYCGPKWISIFNHNKLLGSSKLSPTIILCKAGGELGPAAGGGGGGGGAVIESEPVFGDYVYVTGMIGAGAARIDPMYRAQGYRVPYRAVATPYRVSMVGAEGEELTGEVITVTHHHGPHPECGCDHEDEEHAEAFFVSVPYREGVRRVRIMRHGEELLAVDVPRAEPSLEIVEQPAGGDVGDEARLTWRGEHPDGAALTYWVRYSIDDGETWQPLTIGLRDPSFVVPVATLPGGERCRLQVAAHDGFHSVYRETEAFAVPLRPPEATILTPADGEIVGAGQTVLFRGEGYSPQEGSLPPQSVRWSSDRDGDLGTGKRLYARLSPGRHVVSLAVTDARGDRAVAAVTVTSEGEPG